MSRRIRRAIFNILALAVVAFNSTTASAGNIYGSWDPQFNGTFSGTGFLGQVVFFVPDACLSNGTPSTSAYFADTATCSGGGMSLVSAQVSLYNYPNTASIINTITFAPPLPPTDPILGIFVAYSATGVPTVIGLDTDPIGPKPSGVSAAIAPSPLYLVFASGSGASPYNADSDFPLGAGAYLLPQSCPTNAEVCYPDFSPNSRSNGGQVTYTPEPGSLALLLSAFGASWLVRRRTTAS